MSKDIFKQEYHIFTLSSDFTKYIVIKLCATAKDTFCSYEYLGQHVSISKLLTIL